MKNKNASIFWKTSLCLIISALARTSEAGGAHCGPPDVPLAAVVPISNVGTSSVTLAWLPNNNAAPPGTVYSIKTYARTGSPPFFFNPPCNFNPDGDPTAFVSSMTTTNLTAVVNDLNGETTYYFYVRALPEGGGAYATLLLSTVTLPGGPPYTFSTSHATGTWTNARAITLRAAGGHHYRWVYLDANPNTFFTVGSGANWDGLPLPLALVSEGTSYFHADGFSAKDTLYAQVDLGPFLLDSVPPDIVAVVAQSSATDATPLTSGVPNSASNPRFSWAPPASLSPIVGYSYAIGPGNPVVALSTNTTNTFVDFLAPAFGTYTINVKALDAAGNWGAVASFVDIYVKFVPSASSFTPKGNVFNPKLGQSMTLDYALAQPGRVKVKLYTLQGDLVKVLLDEDDAAGSYRTTWAGNNTGGKTVASGIYLLVIEAPGYKKTHKVAILK